jgi:two-component system, NarL family, invasion response regulator UvrY
MIKILVADIHPVVRLGVKAILSGVRDMEVVDEAANGLELLAKAERNDYDVIIFEIDLQPGKGLDCLRNLRKKNSKASLLVFTHLPEDPLAVRALKMGAAGYLSKESGPEDLVDAIRKIAQGRKHITPDLADLLADTLDLNLDKPVHEMLSDKEYQVLALMASGKGQSEIADRLSLTKLTVKTYGYNIRLKMKMRSNSDLVRYAIKNNLVAQTDD